MTSADRSAPDEQRDDQRPSLNEVDQDADQDSGPREGGTDGGGGEVSESAVMTPHAGDDGTPGTDDGVPPAESARTEPGGGPGTYGD